MTTSTCWPDKQEAWRTMDFDSPKAWIMALEDDMMKLRTAKIRLPALFKRLTEAAEGVDRKGHWSKFSGLGGGSSTQHLRDNNGQQERVIVLRFASMAAASDLEVALRSLLNGLTKLSVLKKVDCQNAARGEGGTLTISFPEPRR